MDFEKYLAKKNAQKRIDQLSKKYKDKKIILYGTGMFANKVFENYDLSKLNIVAVADLKFEYKSEFQGLPVIDPYLLREIDFDVLLLGLHQYFDLYDFLEDDLFYNFKPKFKIEPLIKLSLLDYIRGV